MINQEGNIKTASLSRLSLLFKQNDLNANWFNQRVNSKKKLIISVSVVINIFILLMEWFLMNYYFDVFKNSNLLIARALASFIGAPCVYIVFFHKR